MYLLVLCSVAVTAIGIERFRFYRFTEKGRSLFIEELSAALKDNDIARGMEVCKARHTVFASLAAAGMEAALRGKNVEFALDSAYSTAAMKLRAYINYLSMVVTLAPLLGLLGTISGMIESFSIFNLQAGQPMAITGGIGEALVATATGLCVAIFALIVHTYFAQKLDEKLSELDTVAAMVLDGTSDRGAHNAP